MDARFFEVIKVSDRGRNGSSPVYAKVPRPRPVSDPNADIPGKSTVSHCFILRCNTPAKGVRINPVVGLNPTLCANFLFITASYRRSEILISKRKLRLYTLCLHFL